LYPERGTPDFGNAMLKDFYPLEDAKKNMKKIRVVSA